MKHLAAAVLAIVLMLFAGVVIWSNRQALTVPILGFSGACLGASVIIALGTDGKEALTTLAGLIPTIRSRGAS